MIKCPITVKAKLRVRQPYAVTLQGPRCDVLVSKASGARTGLGAFPGRLGTSGRGSIGVRKVVDVSKSRRLFEQAVVEMQPKSALVSAI